jgi:hypothetical protein
VANISHAGGVDGPEVSTSDDGNVHECPPLVAPGSNNPMLS